MFITEVLRFYSSHLLGNHVVVWLEEEPGRRPVRTHHSNDICDDCESTNLKFEEIRGEIVCDDCGSVKEDNIPYDMNQDAKRGKRVNEKIGSKPINKDELKYLKDHSGNAVSIDFQRTFRGANKTEKYTRSYDPDVALKTKFRKQIRPYIERLREIDYEAEDEVFRDLLFEHFEDLEGRSQRVEARRHHHTNARSSYPQELTNRVMAAVLVYEVQRDSRGIIQKLQDISPFKYSIKSNSRSRHMQRILQLVSTDWPEFETERFSEKKVRNYITKLLRLFDHMYDLENSSDYQVRIDTEKATRSKQLEDIFVIVCEEIEGLPVPRFASKQQQVDAKIEDSLPPAWRSKVPLTESKKDASSNPTTPETVDASNALTRKDLDMIQEILEHPDFPPPTSSPSKKYTKYPNQGLQSNNLVTCHLEIVNKVLKNRYGLAAINRRRVYDAVNDQREFSMPTNSNRLRSYEHLADELVNELNRRKQNEE
jgi:hypothetical protein